MQTVSTNTKPQQGNQTVHFISVQIFSYQMSSFGPRLLAGSLIEFSFVFWNKCKTVSTNIKPQQGNETVHFMLSMNRVQLETITWIELNERLILTHTNPKHLISDCFPSKIILHLKCKLSCQIELWFASAPELFGILSDCHCCYIPIFYHIPHRQKITYIPQRNERKNPTNTATHNKLFNS